MDIERILKAIKDSPEIQNLLGEVEEEYILEEGSQHFYKPAYYELDEEYRKYREMLQKGEKDKTIFFRIGRIYHYWENLEEAIKYYDKAIEIDPDYREVHYNLGNIYSCKDDLKKSKEHYIKAIDSDPDDIYALNALAKIYFKLKKFDKAETYHRKALENNAQDLYALRGLGNVHLVRQEYGEALSYYRKALDVNPFDNITLYNTGLVYLLSGKIEKAENHYKENVEKYNFFGFYFGLGLCCYKAGNKEDAYRHFRGGLLKEYGTELDILFNLMLEDSSWNLMASEFHFCKGKAYYSLNNLVKAIEEVELAIEFNTDFLEPHKFLGRLYFEKGDLPSAIKHYENCMDLEEEKIVLERLICELRLNLEADNLELLKRLQYIYWLREDFGKEIEILENIIKLTSEPEYFYKLGCAYLSRGEKFKGEEIFKRLLELKKQEELAHIGFARLYSTNSEYHRAVKSIDMALSIVKKSEYYIEAGNIFGQIGEDEKALECYLEAFKLSPCSRIAHRHYVDCLLATRKEEARNFILKLSSLPGYNLLLALFYIRLGDYEKAKQNLVQIELTPENTGLFHLYMGICYQAEGYFERALGEFQNSLLIEEFKGDSYGLRALIYRELGNIEKAIEMISGLSNFIRFMEPLLRYRICVLMWQEGLREQLQDFLSKTIWSINFHHYFSVQGEKEIFISELNEIRRKLPEELIKSRQVKLETRDLVTEDIKKKVEQVVTMMSVDPLSIELGRGIMGLVDPNQGAKLVERITNIRRHIALELGILIPNIRFRDNLQLKPSGYKIKVKDIVVASGEVMINRFLAIGPEKYLKPLKGPVCIDPTYDMPAVWITTNQRGKAEKMGCMVFEPVSVIATQLTEVIRKYAPDLLGLQEVKLLLDTIKKSHPDLVKEIYPKNFTFVEIQQVLQNLLREKIPVRDLVTILETMLHYSHTERSPYSLTEYVRASLSRVICREYEEDGVLNVIGLDEELENIILRSLEKDENSLSMSMEPEIEKIVLKALADGVQEVIYQGFNPVILCSPEVRRPIKNLTWKSSPNLTVMSREEIAPEVKVEYAGQVKLPKELVLKAEKSNIYLYYAEKMCQDGDPFVRCEGIESLSCLVDKKNLEKIFTYLEAGLEDKNKNVRHSAARVIKELCSKRLAH